MEDFVYIILVIAWLVFSIMKKKPKTEAPAKPRPASSPQPANPTREFDLEEALKGLFGGQPNPIPQPVPEPVADKAPAEPVFENAEPEYVSMAEELSSYQEPEYKPMGLSVAVPEEYQFVTEVRTQTLEELLKANALEDARQQAALEMQEGYAGRGVAIDFDIRDAVIYSEILNRKYS